jgi:hypothetical protein
MYIVCAASATRPVPPDIGAVYVTSTGSELWAEIWLVAGTELEHELITPEHAGQMKIHCAVE